MRAVKNNPLLRMPLTLILVPDKRLGGYTSFFKQIPDIISQGETEREAIQNLMNAIHDVFIYESQEKDDQMSDSSHIIRRSINFCSENYV